MSKDPGSEVWASLRVVITAGPTREWLDPVRYMTNPSSGQMGFQLAEQLAGRCRELIYIFGKGDSRFAQPVGAQHRPVSTTQEMLEAVRGAVGQNTVLIMSAAPLDFHFATQTEKMKKEGRSEVTLKLFPNPDILKTIHAETGDLPRFFKVGFAAETSNIEEYGRQKLEAKGLDLIFINQVHQDKQGFGPGDNQYLVLDKFGGRTELGPAPKHLLAPQMIGEIGRVIAATG